MPKHARFGVAEIDGEDEESGDVWFQIGLIENDGEMETVPDELAVVMLRDAERMEREFPGIKDRKAKTAKVIAEALTEYAERHELAEGWFV